MQTLEFGVRSSGFGVCGVEFEAMGSYARVWGQGLEWSLRLTIKSSELGNWIQGLRGRGQPLSRQWLTHSNLGSRVKGVRIGVCSPRVSVVRLG